MILLEEDRPFLWRFCKNFVLLIFSLTKNLIDFLFIAVATNIRYFEVGFPEFVGDP